ncbi:hypothetical protein N9N03_01995 [Chlamydiia bacterium]|nr:hypothetical protein [Chlamydiia bacterium]
MVTNIDDAYNSGKYSDVFVIFTGSGWGSESKELSENILSSKDFHTYVKTNDVGLVMLDYTTFEE